MPNIKTTPAWEELRNMKSRKIDTRLDDANAEKLKNRKNEKNERKMLYSNIKNKRPSMSISVKGCLLQ